MIEANTTVVRRLVDEVFNGGHLEILDELYTPQLGRGGPTLDHAVPGQRPGTSTWRSWS